MTPLSLDAIFDVLLETSIAGGIVALATWTFSSALARLSAVVRCTLWWLVSLKLLVGLLAIDPLPIPVLPAADAPMVVERTDPASAAVAGVEAAAPVGSFPWRPVLVSLWVAGIGVAALVGVRQWRRLAATRSTARPADASLTERVRALADRIGLDAAPDVLLSDRVDAPIVIGPMRPAVILPQARWQSLGAAEQDMALCHELVHLRRGDLWLGLVPVLAERIFFFHPLAHLAAREYVVAREAACDAAVLNVLDAEPRDYGTLLVRLGIVPSAGPVCASGAAQSFSSLKRRIRMLDHRSPTTVVRLSGWLIASAAVLALVPLKLVARPAAAVTEPAQEDKTPKLHKEGSGFSYMLTLGDDNGIVRSGDLELGRTINERDQGLWFRLGGRTYEVRDPASIDQAAAIVKPVSEIGRQQGEIGAKQGLIGAQQGIVGAKQGEVGARQGAIGAQQGLLGARQGVLGARQAADLTDAEKEQIEKEQQQIDREMHELNAKMAALDKEMREVSESMPDLSVDMEKLSKQMEILSGKMAAASAKADAQMRELAEKLIKLGTAKPIN